jgi:hypothetical protein
MRYQKRGEMSQQAGLQNRVEIFRKKMHGGGMNDAKGGYKQVKGARGAAEKGWFKGMFLLLKKCVCVKHFREEVNR